MSHSEIDCARRQSLRPQLGRSVIRAALALLAAMALPLFGATYYVDFVGGNNAADGLTPETAWKHSPGDRNATDNPRAAALQPGDTVIFKGGVAYHGEIELSAAGAEGKPIALDGNTAGTFGQGRAVLDGARVITGWKPVESAEQVEGNPRWREIMRADIEVDLSSNFNHDRFVLHRGVGAATQAPWQRVFLIDGERRLLPIAQTPKPSDPFYPDLPDDFRLSPHRLTNDYPHRVYYEEGTIGNLSLPLIAITYGGPAPVIQPFNGGAVSVDLAEPAMIAEMGFTLFRPASTPAPEHIAFLVDGKEMLRATVDQRQTAMQRFALPTPVEARKLTFRLLHANPGDTAWTKLQQIAAFTPTGENIIHRPISTVLRDDEHLTRQDPKRYEGLFVGAHGGNNHTYFARARRYDPATRQLFLPFFEPSTYEQTRYALYNSPRFIELPGEWCLAPLEGGRTRVFLLPDRLEGGQPVNIAYPVLQAGILLSGAAAHIEVRGFLVQRRSGDAGGIATRAAQGRRPSHIRIADCEVRFVSGNAGISLRQSDHLLVENCFVHHCPGWTVGIFVNRVNHFQLLNNRLYKNSGSGIRHYEATRGALRGNVALNHFGMHSSGVNLYEGCRDILFEGNYVQNAIAINRSAERLSFHNNIVDGLGRSPVAVVIYGSGSVGGRHARDLRFINNTLVNTNTNIVWATGILAPWRGSPDAPEGLIIRNNVLDGLAEDITGVIENNIYTRNAETRFMAGGNQVIADPAVLFRDPARGDFRRKPGGPAMDVGADVPPPPPEWRP